MFFWAQWPRLKKTDIKCNSSSCFLQSTQSGSNLTLRGKQTLCKINRAQSIIVTACFDKMHIETSLRFQTLVFLWICESYKPQTKRLITSIFQWKWEMCWSHLSAVWSSWLHKQRSSGVLSSHNVAVLSWKTCSHHRAELGISWEPTKRPTNSPTATLKEHTNTTWADNRWKHYHAWLFIL